MKGSKVRDLMGVCYVVISPCICLFHHVSFSPLPSSPHTHTEGYNIYVDIIGHAIGCHGNKICTPISDNTPLLHFLSG